MPYLIAASLTYANSGNGNSARSAIVTAIANLGLSGSVTAGGTGATVTINGTVLDQATAEALEAAIRPGWSASARTGGHVGIQKVGG